MIIPPNSRVKSAMRIAFVLTSLGLGGAEHQAVAVAERLARRDHTLTLLVLGEQVEQEWPTELPVHRLGMHKNPLDFLRKLRPAGEILRTFQPDLVHAHCFHANLFARLLHRGGLQAPVISTIHNIYEGPWPRLVAYRLTDRWAEQTVAVSLLSAMRYVRLGATPCMKIKVIPNGIDTEQFRPDRERREQTRAAMGVADEFVWLTAGRLTRAKDLPNLLHGFAQLAQQEERARLWIAGSGKPRYAAGLKKLARQLGIEDKLRWLGVRRDLEALYDAADGFVLGSAWEGMPLVVAEAMAMEKPVVATDVGGVFELVSAAGRMVDAKDPAFLARGMRETMQLSGEKRQRIGQAARRRIEEKFSLASRVEAWEKEYADLLEELTWA